jgi:hypothetical protein
VNAVARELERLTILPVLRALEYLEP